MFIAISKPSTKSVCILDTDDYTNDVCTLGEVNDFLSKGLKIDGVSLVNNEPVIDIKGRYRYKSDTDLEATVWVRGDGQVVYKSNLSGTIITAKSKIKIPTKDYEVYDVELGENFAIFLVNFTKVVKGEQVTKSVVYKLDLKANSLKSIMSENFRPISIVPTLSEKAGSFYYGEDILKIA